LIHRIIAPPTNLRSVLLKALCGEQAEMDSKVELSGSQANFYQAPWHPATNNVLYSRVPCAEVTGVWLTLEQRRPILVLNN